uniref:AlNc14C1403G12929 protein n=1 Tax=Albugo laibachii Nc14 TaxID=890382 RepID=F0X2P5_9STRA|nr:AlNc14C1403G12929 [Albugo laibachii Nc14]|eukprot:CCA28172.1 AlNc14C1403G12929 [Albugo laibachii Nc14]
MDIFSHGVRYSSLSELDDLEQKNIGSNFGKPLVFLTILLPMLKASQIRMLIRLSLIGWIFFSQDINASPMVDICSQRNAKSDAVGGLYFLPPSGGETLVCAACLIDTMNVATSSSCIRYQVQSPGDRWQFKFQKVGGGFKKSRFVTQITHAPNFQMYQMTGDFAILKLDTPIVEIHPVLISNKAPRVGSKLHIFGVAPANPETEKMIMGTLTVQSTDTCQLAFEGKPPNLYTPKYDGKQLFCAKSQCSAVCEGELGMPFAREDIVNNTVRLILYGIQASASVECDPRKTSSYGVPFSHENFFESYSKADFVDPENLNPLE